MLVLFHVLNYSKNPSYLYISTCSRIRSCAIIASVGEMYYYAFKSIPRGSELLVWYGDGFAAKLGIKKNKNIKYVNAESETLIIENFEQNVRTKR